MNDLLSQVFFRKREVVEELLRVILESPFLEVVNSEIQKSYMLPDSRGIISDIYALDARGIHYGIEIQKEPRDAKAR